MTKAWPRPINCGLAGRCRSGATVTPSGGIVARPHLELGTHGRIRVYPDPAGYRAVCLYRDWDGVTRQVQRQAKTKGAGERALAVALRDWGRAGTSHEITPDTKIADLAEKWFSELEGKSPSTTQAYRSGHSELPATRGQGATSRDTCRAPARCWVGGRFACARGSPAECRDSCRRRHPALSTV